MTGTLICRLDRVLSCYYIVDSFVPSWTVQGRLTVYSIPISTWGTGHLYNTATSHPTHPSVGPYSGTVSSSTTSQYNVCLQFGYILSVMSR